MTLMQQSIFEEVQQALAEDLQTGDVTGQLIPERQFSKAVVLNREAMVLAGTEWFNESIKQCDPCAKIIWYFNEGDQIAPDQQLCVITANSRALLAAERTALNFLQLLSGVATKTAAYVKALHPPTVLLDTRKTLPHLRNAQKYAVKCGGGANHRFGLYDAYLIKENHIKACGSIAAAVRQARDNAPELLLEVEVEDLEQLAIALEHDIDRIMLDNFSIEMIVQAIQLRGQRPIKFEVSGNITLENITQYSKTGVDYISVGSLTKSVQAIDLSLLVREVWHD